MAPKRSSNKIKRKQEDTSLTPSEDDSIVAASGVAEAASGARSEDHSKVAAPGVAEAASDARTKGAAPGVAEAA